ncbi:MAG: hypothetical protein ACRD4X_15170 [Candidatus Acidiferrales bacterium]
MAKAYEIKPELAGYFNIPMRLLVLVGLGSAISLRLMIHYVWPSTVGAPNTLSDLVNSADFGLVFSWIAIFFVRKQSSCEILVSDDSIAVRRAFFTHRIRKSEMKTVVDTPGRFLSEPGLRILKDGGFGAWVWGGIWIPKALPDYEHIRNFALSWKNSVA